MTFFILKVIISALLIASASELAKRSTPLAALLIGFPVNSLLTFFWLYVATGKTGHIFPLSWQITLASIPSLIFLTILAALLKVGIDLRGAITISLGSMLFSQLGYILLLQKMGLKI